jgi:hypothetical protein
MLITLKFRERVRAVAQVIVDELEQVVASITTGWRVEHNDDGTHGDVTADSIHAGPITSDGIIIAIGSQGIRVFSGTKYVTLGTDATNALLQSWVSMPLYINKEGNPVVFGNDKITFTTSSGAAQFSGAITSNGGLQTFGANDSAGAGYRYVVVPNA